MPCPLGVAMGGGISVHAVDVANGRIARGMLVQIDRIEEDGARLRIAEGRIAADGTLDHPVAQGAGVRAGLHEILLHVGAFFAGSDRPPPPFLDVVPFRFRVFDDAQHYHLPVKFTPWGMSLYRGA
ncbi:hydroxyisourate hydrolase [Falsiroseomonas sp. CW058]|uniref:hydroxyisourate hydrolase n=1 Tax=Falsiroseomonas sp. CW058 TaxID=3388664 RepID=UPI003D31B0F7